MNIRTIRKKIKSVTNVKKITKAMQLVSAIKMKKAQQVAIDGRPYQTEIENIIRAVSPKIDPSLSPLIAFPEDKIERKNLAIVVASNKGLCGSFNFNLLRFIVKNTDFKNTDFIIVGKKANLLSKFSANIMADYSSNVPLNNVSALFDFALNKYLDRTYKKIELYHNLFVSTIQSNPVVTTLLPIKMELGQEKTSEYLIEPNPKKIIDSLLRSFVEEKLRFALIQSEAGEHSLRMMAMKNATDNATDVIYNLTMVRNKIRQEKITSELLDMVTAKESVESN
ncbi:ATP synthase F1 subunit gamma [Candidatus Roizmanbacteria bacterium CG_4_10_14_0_2_um_filter_33_96]|uniref:ATP synthase gamma chain n=1 Tax=Candidatus Roizmanbacteria bacterium CG_4_10_14_0_2_um_filter_33_96 TaxID=1974821 RepID=A0A2M7U814_9BACT|nr:MAG: ATP synthase F1 subunit gamma [Candidatus Roizmanbacteria bacterium CG_4_10_14_0_2_um_filter_33_96]